MEEHTNITPKAEDTSLPIKESAKVRKLRERVNLHLHQLIMEFLNFKKRNRNNPEFIEGKFQEMDARWRDWARLNANKMLRKANLEMNYAAFRNGVKEYESKGIK